MPLVDPCYLGEIEPFPARRSTIFTPLSERHSAARVSRHAPLSLTFDILIHPRHPTVDLVGKCPLATLHHMLASLIHSPLRWLDVSVVIVLAVRQKLADDLHGMLYAPRGIPKGLVRAENHEHVRHGWRRETQIGSWPEVLPNGLLPCWGVAAAEQWSVVLGAPVDSVESARDGVEAGREDENVQLMLFAVQSFDALGCDGVNGRFLQIYQVHVGFIVGLEVTAFQRYSSRAKAMICGDQGSRNVGIVDSIPDLFCHERGIELVGLGINVRVAEYAEPLAETWLGIEFFPQSESILVCHFR